MTTMPAAPASDAMGSAPAAAGAATAPDATRQAARMPGWDALKGWVTLLVVLHHTAITYGAQGGWFYIERRPDGHAASLLLTLFCATDQAWFMGLFFLLAGRFVPPALARSGTAGFLRERLLRLAVPWLVFGCVLGPLTVALADTAVGDPFIGSLQVLWARKIFVPGPLWFAQALLLFSLAAALWRRWWPRTAPAATAPLPSDRHLLLAALGCALTAFAVRLWWPVGTELWHMQLGYFPMYLLLFAVGCLAAQPQWLERVPADRMRRWRRIGLCALPVLPVAALLGKLVPALGDVLGDAPTGGWNLPSIVYALWEPFVAWGAILWLLWRFGLGAGRQRRTGGAAVAGWRAALARRAYAIYVIHPPVIVATALLWRGVAAPALLKFAVTGAAACLLCHALAGLLLRLPGVRRVL